MAEVLVTPRAERDIREAVVALGLPTDTGTRVAQSLRILEDFPRAGRQLTGRWRGTRFILGPWPWMLLLYVYDDHSDRVWVVAMHDARSSTAATSD